MSSTSVSRHEPDGALADARDEDPSSTEVFRGLRAHGDPVEKTRLLAKLEGRLFERRAGPLRLSRYELGDRLGVGAMGLVYRAFDPALGRDVALKLIHTGRTKRDAQKAKERLRREARALARLSHPNIVRIYDVGLCDTRICDALELSGAEGANPGGGLYVVMELVEGRTLDAWIRASNPKSSEIVDAFVAAGRGLIAAHAAGVIHRDFKPTNVMMGEDGRTRVLDFGLAQLFGPDPSTQGTTRADPAARTLTESELPATLTRTGEVAGTPAYMAPEVFRERRSDLASDQFSFCVALYECLYGERPFRASSVDELIEAVANHRVSPPPDDARVSTQVRRVLLRGLHPDPAGRYPSMQYLVSALERAPRARLMRSLVWAVPAMLSFGALGAWACLEGPLASKRCSVAEQGIESRWNPDRAQRIGAAWAGHDQAWTRVRRALDEHARGWERVRAEICETQPADDVAELRVQCLEQRRRELHAAVDFVAKPSPKIVGRALESIVALPSADQCSDATVRRVAPRPPAFEQLRGVSEVRGRLAELRLAVGFGSFDEALLEDLSKAVADADGTGYAPVRAEARFVRALAFRELGRSDQAALEYEQAYLAADSAGAFATALDAATQLVAIHGLDRGDPHRARRWIEHARAVLTRGRWSPDSKRALALRGQVAAVRAAEGDVEAAIASYGRILQDARGALGPRHPMVASLLNNRANLHADQGAGELAREEYAEALQIEREAHGSNHPRVASMLDNLANLWDEDGHLERALGLRREALQIQEQALGEMHERVARTLTNLGTTSMRMERLDEARGWLERAVDIYDAVPSADESERLRALMTLAGVLAASGRTSEARSRYERARIIAEVLGKPDGAEAVAALAGEASLASRAGDHERALEAYTDAIGRTSRSVGPEHPDVARLRRHRGVAHRRAGRLELALADLKRALAIALDRDGALTEFRASVHHALGDVFRLRGEPRAAVREYRQALALRSEVRGLPGETARSHEGLAHAWRESGRLDEARKAARASIARYSEDGLPNDAHRVSAWLRNQPVRRSSQARARALEGARARPAKGP